MVLLPHHGEGKGALGALVDRVRLLEPRRGAPEVVLHQLRDLLLVRGHPEGRLFVAQVLGGLLQGLQPVLLLGRGAADRAIQRVSDAWHP